MCKTVKAISRSTPSIGLMLAYAFFFLSNATTFEYQIKSVNSHKLVGSLVIFFHFLSDIHMSVRTFVCFLYAAMVISFALASISRYCLHVKCIKHPVSWSAVVQIFWLILFFVWKISTSNWTFKWSEWWKIFYVNKNPWENEIHLKQVFKLQRMWIIVENDEKETKLRTLIETFKFFSSLNCTMSSQCNQNMK